MLVFISMILNLMLILKDLQASLRALVRDRGFCQEDIHAFVSLLDVWILYKARLGAKGMIVRTRGIDFERIICSSARLESDSDSHCSRSKYGTWSLSRWMWKTAFLNGELNEVVELVQTDGYVEPEHPSHCVTDA
ncbi:hypothetical protein Tco_1219745 [Tanacetum coccineum]